MKNLTIVYDGITLFDAQVAELGWIDSPAGVKVEGKTKPTAKAGSAAGGILEALGSGLASASKAKTQRIVEEKAETVQ